MTEFAKLRTETNSYLSNDSDKNKKVQRTKKCVLNRKRRFEDYKHC